MPERWDFESSFNKLRGGMESANNPIARQKEIVVQELKGEGLIYDLKTNKA